MLRTNDYLPKDNKITAKVTGVWGIGSSVAGRCKKDRNIEIWIPVDTLTKLGEKFVLIKRLLKC